MSIPTLVAFVVTTLVLTTGMTSADPAAQVVIEENGLEPRTLDTLTGERVSFVNRTGQPVHLQLVDDIHQHEVIQIPVTGPIWAVFHRPGTHPYIVHVYGRVTRALEGVVRVTLDETHRWEAGTCDVIVEGNCIEP
jgi:hypothetical protein